MDENTQIVNDKILAEDVSSKIKYEMRGSFLVKPLDPVMVEKEISTPIPTETKIEDGMEVTDYEEVKTEIKKVESEWGRGVVLKVPYTYSHPHKDHLFNDMPIEVGDTIIYHTQIARQFDIFKNSVLVDYYAIAAVEK